MLPLPSLAVARRTPALWLQKGARPNEAAARARQAGIRDAEGRQVNRTRPLGSTLARRPSGWQLLARLSWTVPSDHDNLARGRVRGRRHLGSATCDTAFYSDLLHVAGRGILTVFGAHSRSHPAGFPRAATMAKRHAPWHSLVLAWVRHRGSHVALEAEVTEDELKRHPAKVRQQLRGTGRGRG